MERWGGVVAKKKEWKRAGEEVRTRCMPMPAVGHDEARNARRRQGSSRTESPTS